MSVRRNAVANYAGQIVTAGLSLALVPIYVRWLGIEAWALVGLFASLQVWMALLDGGMTPALGRELARFTAGTASVQFVRELLHSFEIVCAGLGVAVATLLLAAAGPLARDWLRVGSLPLDSVANALALMGLVIALRFAEGLYRGGIVGLQQQVWLNAATVTQAVVRGFGALGVLAFVSPTVEAFFLWQAAVSLLSLAAFGAKLHLALPPAPARVRFSPAALVAVRGYAGGMLGMTALAAVLTQVDKLLLSRLLPLAEFGYYVLATAVSGMLMLAVAPISQAAFPALVRLTEQGDTARLSAVYRQAVQLVSVALGPATLVLALFAEPLLFAWTGDRALAARAAPLLALLGIGTFLNALMQLPVQLYLAHGRTRLPLIVNGVAVAVLVPALLVLVPREGAFAAAAVWAALNVGYVVVMTEPIHRVLPVGAAQRWLLTDIALPLTAAALVVVPIAMVAPLLSLGRLEAAGALIASGLFASLAALLAASLLRPRLIAAWRTIAARRLNPRRWRRASR